MRAAARVFEDVKILCETVPSFCVLSFALVCPESLNDLASAMVRVLRDTELRTRLGAAARERVATMTWDATAAGILEQLHAVVTGGEQPPPNPVAGDVDG